MKEFINIKTTQIVKYNNDNPDKQLIDKEDVITEKRFFWGLIIIKDHKDITQLYGTDKPNKLGFK